MSFKIHWLCAAPSPYNNYLFKALAADPEIDLQVHFRKGRLSSHPWVSQAPRDFPARYYEEVFGVDKELVGLALKDETSLFVLAGWNHATAWAVLNILIIRGRPFVVWTDTPDLSRKRAWIKDELRSRWLRTVFGRATAVMGTGTPGVKALQEMGCPAEKTVDFPYWVPLPRDWDARKSPPVDSLRFFSVGQLIARKGYDLALRALGRVFRHNLGNKRNVEYWIFGDGPERKNLEMLAEEMGIAEIVKFWGWREPSFIQREIREADVLVHPALWEPFGVVVLEAMALGKPVIASDRTMAAVCRVRNGTNGFIHAVEDVEQLSDHLGYFVENPARISPMGKEARSTGEEWPVERAVEIVKRLASGARG